MKCKHLFFIFLNLILAFADDVLVNLPLGPVLGSEILTNQNVTYFAFEQVPYAQPPLGPLRFQAPKPIQAWKDVKNCTHFNVTCYQLTAIKFQESEDCLYLNIYTPKLPNEITEPLVPVMFFIHGGGFTDKVHFPYSPSFESYGVVLVMINYRLGPFGFLSTGDKIIPGNNGLKDQHLALEWVHSYIRYFGGDNQKVTIFGHSAGSASVGYHLLNPKSENLFWAAICQSGSALSIWAYQRNPRDTAFKFAKFLDTNFTITESESLLNFLENVDAKEISEAAKRFNKNIFNGTVEDFATLQGISWAPTLEVESKNAFISKKMYKLMKEGQFVKVPLMIGFTTEENLNFHFEKQELETTAKQYDSNLSNLVPLNMPIDPENKTQYGLRIRNYYTNRSEFSKCLEQIVTFSSDNDMTRPITKFAELFSKFAQTFFYVFMYDGETGSYPTYFNISGKVGHAEELYYLFPDYTDNGISDKTTRKRLLTMWTNFAKFRNPTPERVPILQNVSWPTVKNSSEGENFAYLEIGENLVPKKSTPKAETYQMWSNLYSELNDTDLATF